MNQPVRRQFSLTPRAYAALRREMEAGSLTDQLSGAAQVLTAEQRVTAAWVRLGEKFGFDGRTVEPVPGRDGRWFTAEVRQ